MAGKLSRNSGLLGMVLDVLEEIETSGPYLVSEEWFTLRLRMPHVRILFLILLEGTVRMNRLAYTLGISMSGATNLVDRLVELELVGRWPDPEDRRAVLCDLTEEGALLARRLLAERRSRWEERLANLRSSELEVVFNAMKLILDSTKYANVEVEALSNSQ